MTLTISRKALAIAGALIVAGGAVAAFLLLREPAKDCRSDAGVAVSCDDAGALSQVEFEQKEQDEAAAEEAKLLAAKCERQLGGLRDELQELDSRLAVGLSYDEYTNQVGSVRVAYDKVPIDRLELDCLLEAGADLEDAMNAYVKAGDSWDGCIEDFDCDMDSVDPELQRQWNKATEKIESAEAGLRDLAKP